MPDDPVFRLPTPLVFAHRGGTKEKADSTLQAFEHAFNRGADVLEFDLLLTKDGVPLVWHGPDLGKVYNSEGKLLTGKYPWEFTWPELDGRAWVVDPTNPEDRSFDQRRRLLSLHQFALAIARLERVAQRPTPIPWNIEIKDIFSRAKATKLTQRRRRPRWGKRTFKNVFKILDRQPIARKILLAGALGPNLIRTERAMRKRSRRPERYALNLSMGEQARFRHLMSDQSPLNQVFMALAAGLATRRKTKSLQGRAFQTSHALLEQRLIDQVHRRGGAVHAFLTDFPGLPGIEDLQEPGFSDAVKRILDLGVDGVMTDRPERVVCIVDAWKQARLPPAAQ